jgi:thymidylate synthase ThyX
MFIYNYLLKSDKMKIKLEGSTNNLTEKKDILDFSAAAARVCYSEKDFDTLVKENKKKLIEGTLKSGHHSVYGHVHLNFYIDGIPKIGAMILNNERDYATSEKSARYTQMEPVPHQKELYNKWMTILEKKIDGKYGKKLDELKIKKLAQENARYMTSVFTPTKMVHTLSFRQLNYIMHYFEEFIENSVENSKFYEGVKDFMSEFNKILKPFYVDNLRSRNDRHLSFFAKRKDFKEEFGENYSTNYNVSFACLAQLHRHRTISYEMRFIGDDELQGFFMPRIFNGDEKITEEWNKDIGSVADYDYPQGMLINIHESGKYTDFITKMHERLCGHAQWEIMDQTKKTLDEYIKAAKDNNEAVYNELVDYTNGPRCTFPNVECRGSPCAFGKKSLERLI